MGVPNFSLEGKVALVTGGSRGIGRSIALAFAHAGADVAVTSRKIEALEKVAEECRAFGKRALAVAAHAGKPDELRTMVQRVMDEFGRRYIGKQCRYQSDERSHYAIRGKALGFYYESQLKRRCLFDERGCKYYEKAGRRKYHQYNLGRILYGG